MALCLALVIVQLVNIQLVRGPSLRASASNPGNFGKVFQNQRGNIYAADGTLLAQSVPASSGSYKYMRTYPQGSLYSQVVGYSSLYWGTAGIENQYNNDLITHTKPPQTLSQTLGLDPLQTTRDSLTLTIVPKLQEAARTALSHIAGTNRDGAVVAITPQTGAIVADYSAPTTR